MAHEILPPLVSLNGRRKLGSKNGTGKTGLIRKDNIHVRGMKAGRGKGKRGGSGMAGLGKHRAVWILKYDS